MKKLLLSLGLSLLTVAVVSGKVTRERDVIYQYAEGVALTLEVFTPEEPNGLGIVSIVSGGWKSSHGRVKDDHGKLYTDAGYTVFAVVHGSQPRYQVRDVMGFVHRAVRFIRYNANRWDVDPDRLGVTGYSAGGHLSLILATQGSPGDPKSKDPVERTSSAVQAAAVFYPPVDYLNWRHAGDDAVGVGPQARWQPAFGPESATAEGRQKLGRAMSSYYHISETTAPTLIIHGDIDPIVPLYQAHRFMEVAEAKDVATKLIVKKGGKHNWPDRHKDEVAFLAWFNQQLQP
ncbi:MAG: prolyl oligopeptidase family serine peptidase [Opitutaceae bacterium]|nr:prolyl oligopeptidase family serine peptidase [Opitutaceae bacterium]